LLSLCALLAWDVWGQGDMWLAHLMGGAQHFPQREGFWGRDVLHSGVRWLTWPFALALIIAIACGRGLFAALPRVRRLQLILVPLIASGVVALVKSFSQTSCPWALAEFGGQAQHLSHWLGWWRGDGGSGRCFPAGHASTGFAFVGGWFALRAHHPRLARCWLMTALGVGLALGLAQQWRGAHFMSHTLWTAWLCWCVGWLCDGVFRPSFQQSWPRQVRFLAQLFGRFFASFPAKPVPVWWVVLAASVWMAVAGNLPLWRRMGALHLHDGQMTAGMAVMLVCALFALISLFAARRMLKPVVTALLLVTAFASYFSGAYGVLMTPGMMTNVLQTDPQEARDLFSWVLLWQVGWLAVLPSLLLWRVRVAPVSWGRRLGQQALGFVGGLVGLLLTAWVIFQPFSAAMRNHKDLRYLFNPLAVLYSVASASAHSQQQGRQPLQTIADDAHLLDVAEDVAAGETDRQRPRLLMLVVGEAARSSNFSLNGYERATNQALAGMEVVSLTNAWSCGTSTAESLPCMFSHLPRSQHVKDKSRYENLLDVLHKAGFAVLWLENQSGCKGACERVPTVEVCEGEVCMDEALLHNLDERIAALEPQRRARGIVLVLHQMGSHGPAYSLRSPHDVKAFLPECTVAALAQCSDEHIRNAYDNSLRYTSQILARAIDWLRSQQAYDTAMMYVSDHGESLGEGNLYLHGLPYALAPAYQKHIPWLIWLSPSFLPDAQRVRTCLHQRRDERVSHDHYFHTVLGLMQLGTHLYQTELDALAPCRQ